MEGGRPSRRRGRAHEGPSPAVGGALGWPFKTPNPPPIGGGPRSTTALGKRIYEEGLPESNVPACSASHGIEAHRQNEIPRLAGQLYAYSLGQFTGWGKGRRQETPPEPPPIPPPTP